MKSIDPKEKINKFLKWLIKATNDNNISWRQDRYGQELFTANVICSSGKGEINFIINDNVKFVKIVLTKDVHIAPVCFLIASNDLTYDSFEEISRLYEAIQQRVKTPEWVTAWFDKVIEDI